MFKQRLEHRLSQKLSPQQIQLMKLIQLPTLAFEDRLRSEIEENPAIEQKENDEYDSSNDVDVDVDKYIGNSDIPTYKTKANNYSVDDEEKHIPYASGETFNQILLTQISTFKLTDTEYQISKQLIGSIDSDGYLRRDILDISDDMIFTQNIIVSENEIKDILENVIHKLEPYGVGARDLKECLLLQLNKKEQRESVCLAIDIMEKAFDSLVKKHYSKLESKFSVDRNTLKQAINEIEKLNPRPGGSMGITNKFAQHIIPDFTIRIVDGELELTLNGRNAPNLQVSSEYVDMFQTYKDTQNKTKSQKEAVLYVKQKLDSAQWFIDAILQRQQTLMRTMGSIMNFQKKYFLSGDDKDLKPMILKDISTEIEMDISTVSRVANSKYVDTPHGVKLIKYFFSESLKNEKGEDVSTKEIKSILKDLIGEEDAKEPLTDIIITNLLKEKGFNIARRTVAKYREQLSLPVARLRKKI